MALAERRRAHIENDVRTVASVRADLHNTSARQFEHQFEYLDFLSDAAADAERRKRRVALESRIADLVAQGYTPSQAAAMVHSKQSREDKVRMIDAAGRSAARKAKTRAG